MVTWRVAKSQLRRQHLVWHIRFQSSGHRSLSKVSWLNGEAKDQQEGGGHLKNLPRCDEALFYPLCLYKTVRTTYCIVIYVPITSYYLTLPLTPESKSASISGNNFMVLSMEVSEGSNLSRDPRNWRNSEEALVTHHFPQTNHWNIGMWKPNYAEKSLFQTHLNTHTHTEIS